MATKTSTTFKLKAKKQPLSDSRQSVEIFHKKKLDYFENLQKSLPLKKKELDDLVKNTKEKDKDNIYITKVKELKKEISRIENREEETEYWLNNHTILIDYYTNSNISKIANNDDKSNGVLGNFVTINKKNNKAKLLKQYVRNNDYFNTEYLDEFKIDNMASHTCSNCQSIDLVHTSEGIICSDCAIVVDLNADLHKTPGYKELQDIYIQPTFSYKRINHFKEWLNQIQGRENTVIPEQVFIDLESELKKYNIDRKKLKKNKVREFLKKLGHNKYYEHIPYIISSLNGIQAVKMSSKIEQEMITMFEEIQIPYTIHKPRTRKNFLSYSYTLHKFCQLRGYDEFLPSFPLLKSRDKLLEQDKIWKKICRELRWEYIKSV
jgi:hypothetical protein